jgi:hypothetical protein
MSGVGTPKENPDSGSGFFHSTPFGGDQNNGSHVQSPIPLQSASTPLSDERSAGDGESMDPRLC